MPPGTIRYQCSSTKFKEDNPAQSRLRTLKMKKIIIIDYALGNLRSVAKALEKALGQADGSLRGGDLFRLLLLMPQGTRATFDRKTHQRVWQRTTRLTYIHYAARFLENRDPEALAKEVLEHLQSAQKAMQRAWGLSEFGRLAASNPVALDTKVEASSKNCQVF